MPFHVHDHHVQRDLTLAVLVHHLSNQEGWMVWSANDTTLPYLCLDVGLRHRPEGVPIKAIAPAQALLSGNESTLAFSLSYQWRLHHIPMALSGGIETRPATTVRSFKHPV